MDLRPLFGPFRRSSWGELKKMLRNDPNRTRRMCIDCLEIRPMAGRGLCDPCWRVRSAAKTLEELPFRPAVIERYEEYLLMRAQYPEIKSVELAKRMGLCAKTIDRYNAHRLGRNPIKCLKLVGK